MIDRYSYDEMASIFSEVSKFKRWLEVEVALVEALNVTGSIDKQSAKSCISKLPTIDESFVQLVEEREKITNHDLAAFVDVLQAKINDDSAKWIHFGLTSSDVVDTAFSIALSTAGKLILENISALFDVLKQKAIEYKDTPIVGRTHGIHAEPTTFGIKMAHFALQVQRDNQRLKEATELISVGKLSGAVGTYSNISPKVEEIVCQKLGLKAVPATQVIFRDRHAQFMYSLVSTACTIELIATEIRHLARTELSEATEAFGVGQKGSSAMPHKKNPILSERLVGLSRVMRGYLIPAFEDIALWHERDISHSSVERVVFSDACILIHYMLKKATSLIKSLEINDKKMTENLELTFGAIFSQSLLLKLVEKGLSRDDAYRIVQKNSMKAMSTKQQLQDIILEDEQAKSVLTKEDIDEVFSLKRVLKNSNIIIDKLKEIDK
jgi:adenylosuccinate lyase